ncbi:hypothetical protein DSL92_01455 [Billgrantia gudaonensis]|uniref:Uncharacterized protein n=1 Tax=Billgrantia gudaonensis TaxID=376427 RepID=A0A3S0NHQ8_9GAMM|nr:hypothetical protein DSL92_01455 [Halomonas gudaonensis]
MTRFSSSPTLPLSALEYKGGAHIDPAGRRPARAPYDHTDWRRALDEPPRYCKPPSWWRPPIATASTPRARSSAYLGNAIAIPAAGTAESRARACGHPRVLQFPLSQWRDGESASNIAGDHRAAQSGDMTSTSSPVTDDDSIASVWRQPVGGRQWQSCCRRPRSRRAWTPIPVLELFRARRSRTGAGERRSAA